MKIDLDAVMTAVLPPKLEIKIGGNTFAVRDLTFGDVVVLSDLDLDDDRAFEFVKSLFPGGAPPLIEQLQTAKRDYEAQIAALKTDFRADIDHAISRHGATKSKRDPQLDLDNPSVLAAILTGKPEAVTRLKAAGEHQFQQMPNVRAFHAMANAIKDYYQEYHDLGKQLARAGDLVSKQMESQAGSTSSPPSPTT